MSHSDTNLSPPAGLPTTSALSAGMDQTRLHQIADVFQSAMDDGQVSGGVVLVARRGSIVYEQAFGYRSTVPDLEPATTDTIYDLASLSKPVATATAIMLLVEQGKVRLNDPVSAYLPEWKPSDEEASRLAEALRLRGLLRQSKLQLNSAALVPGVGIADEILLNRVARLDNVRLSERAIDDLLTFTPPDRREVKIRHLLTHTAGLDPFERYYIHWPEGGARQRIIDDISSRPLRQAAGEKFIYSDLGFITLAEIVERVSGKNLAVYCRQEIFDPLGMTDTMYCPPADLRPRIAPTEFRPEAEAQTAALRGDVVTTWGKTMCRGRVHDGNAAIQEGISGHAGLFSTARDLARFAQMMLNEGEYGGVRILSPRTVRTATMDHAQLSTGEERGYGWDIRTGFSVQRGDLFTSGYGHTGWTGTSLWLVPDEDLFIVILTNRVHPSGTGDAGPLRGRIANVVAASLIE